MVFKKGNTSPNKGKHMVHSGSFKKGHLGFIKKKGIFKKCKICDKEIYCKPYEINRRKFCSRECFYKDYKGGYNLGKHIVHSGSFKKGHKGFNSGEKLKGNIPWNKNKKGLHLSPASEFKKGSIGPWKDKTFSEEHKNRLKEKRALRVMPTKDTSIEVKMQNLLKNMHIEFLTHQYIKEIEHSYQCDIFIPSMKLIIECDGNYYHNYPYGNERDIKRSNELRARGYKVIRLWESEINAIEPNEFEQLLNKVSGGNIIRMN